MTNGRESVYRTSSSENISVDNNWLIIVIKREGKCLPYILWWKYLSRQQLISSKERESDYRTSSSENILVDNN